MQSVSRRILSAALMVGSLNGVVMIVSVVRDLAFAYRFGTGEIVDAFLIGLLVPNLTVQLIAGSLSFALIPELLRTSGDGEHTEVAKLSSSVAALALGLLFLVTIALVVGRASITGVLTVGFDPQRTELTSFFYLGTLPCILIQGWSLLLGGMLNAKRRFAVVALAPVMRPLAVCMTLAVDWGPGYAPVLLSAYLIGAVAEAAWITLAAVRAGISIKVRWGGVTAPLRRLLHEFVMAVVGSGILSGATLADQYFASLAGAGGVAAYGYGAKVTSVIIGAGALPLGAVVLPHFSEQVRQKKWAEFRSVLLQWSVVVVAFSVPVVALIWIYSIDLVQLLFQRGAFTVEDTQRVALVQRYLALQIPFYLCGILFVRALTSLQHNRLVALVAVINAIINIAGSLLLVRTLGVGGIAVAVTCGYVAANSLAAMFVFSIIQRSIRHTTK
jgi:putative peptidoglycan lipid II flippase